MKKLASMQTWTGALIACLGLTVMAGWNLQSSLLVQLNPEFVAMVFNSAICFVLLGIAFLLPAFNLAKIPALRALIGLIVSGMATAVLLGTAFNTSLGIDFYSLHFWVSDGNPWPGRMAPNSAIGFLLAGLVLMLSRRVTSRAKAIAVHIATFTILILGLTGLVGYTLQLDLLYSWFKASPMPVYTAVGMILTGVGLWSSWHHADWYRTGHYFRDDEKIAFVSAALLIMVAITAGVAGFAAQESTLEKTLSENLSLAVKHRSAVFHSQINQSALKAKSTAERLTLIKLIGELNTQPADKHATDELNFIGQNILDSGVTGVAIYGNLNRRLLKMGHLSSRPPIETDAGLATQASFLWDGTFYLKSITPILDKGIVIGSLVTQEPLPAINDELMQGESLGDTGEIGVCFGKADHVLCYPQFRNPKVAKLTGKSINGKPTPISFAIRGEAGMFKGLDYRGRNVIGAYAPLTKTGLGIVVKKDAAELFQPIREQLQWGIPLLLLFVAASVLFLRMQITPLASRLLRSEQDATDKELHIRTVMDSVNEGILTLDENGAIESFNGAASSIFGYPDEEMIGANISMLMLPGMRAGHEADMQACPADGESTMVGKKNIELPGLHKDGSIFPLELAVNAMDIQGRHLFVWVVRDITERKKEEQALFAEKERLRVTLGSIGDGVITTDTNGNVTYLNAVAETMTGWRNDEAQGQPLLAVFNIVHEYTNEVALNPVEMVLRDEATAGLAEDTILIQRGGAKFAIEDSAAPIRDMAGKLVGVVLVFHDVSQARLMATKMTHQAMHDSLTGLINRHEFERRLELAIQPSQLETKQHTLLYLDLDQFKVVNDTCGHTAGDELLRQLTGIMQNKLRQSDTLARLGGDEFGVLLTSCPTGPALRIAELLRQTVSEFRFVWLDKIFPIGVSIGLVTFQNGVITCADVLRMADAACYVAKDKGRNRIHVYTQEDTEVAQRQGEMGWIGRIQKSLDEGRFVLYSQNILSLAADQKNDVHYEVLLRMKDEDGALIPPMAFIPAAERYGLMVTLDRWVISTAFAHCAARESQTETIEICSINLSGTSLCDDHFLEFVLQQFKLHNIQPNRICFEITETAAITNLAHATTFMRVLKNTGCRFSLDDFGSGMSSFGYLKHLPVDYLKIDGSFVKDMIQDTTDFAMVEAINHIGHVMAIKTIAEFVENDQILEKLRSIGVDFAQGYGVEKPRPL